MTMFLLGNQNALPKEGTAWLVMPDGATYQVEQLKHGITAIPTEQVDTGERIKGKRVVMVVPNGPARIRFEGTGVRRGQVSVETLNTIRDEEQGPTRMITLGDA